MSLFGGTRKSLYDIPMGVAHYVDQTSGADTNTGRSDTSAWKTIAKVNAETFSPGDKILFKRGETWNERLIVPSSGAEGHPITFGAYGSGALPILNGNGISFGGGNGLINLKNHDFVVIEYINIVDSAYCGVFISDCEGAWVRNMKIETCENAGLYCSGVETWFGVSSNINFIDNEVTDVCNAGNQCITITGYVSNAVITGNTVHTVTAASGGEGIDVLNGASDVLVSQNTIYDVPSVGIYMDGSTRGIDGITVTGNLVYDSDTIGIRVASEGVGEVSNIIVKTNIVYNQDKTGIQIAAETADTAITDVLIINNTIYNCGLGDADALDGGIMLNDPDATGVVIRNNIVFDCVRYQIFDSIGADSVDHNLIEPFRGHDDETKGTDFVEADPVFVTNGSDYHLQAASPARNVGSLTLAPNLDYDGVPIPQETNPAIGAYEYVA